MVARADCKTCGWNASGEDLWKVEDAAEKHQEEHSDHIVELRRPDTDLTEFR